MAIIPVSGAGYDAVLSDVVWLLEAARRSSARTVNAIMTATYWLIGQRIVEHEQAGTGPFAMVAACSIRPPTPPELPLVVLP